MWQGEQLYALPIDRVAIGRELLTTTLDQLGPTAQLADRSKGPLQPPCSNGRCSHLADRHSTEAWPHVMASAASWPELPVPAFQHHTLQQNHGCLPRRYWQTLSLCRIRLDRADREAAGRLGKVEGHHGRAAHQRRAAAAAANRAVCVRGRDRRAGDVPVQGRGCCHHRGAAVS